MSSPAINKRGVAITQASWASVAFMVESVLLLVFLVASLAVLTQLFSTALSRSAESRTLDAATIAASSIAEHFAANPSDVQPETRLGDLRIVCDVADSARAGGTMYSAHIDVYDATRPEGSGPVYSLDTSCYQSNSKAGGV